MECADHESVLSFFLARQVFRKIVFKNFHRNCQKILRKYLLKIYLKENYTAKLSCS